MSSDTRATTGCCSGSQTGKANTLLSSPIEGGEATLLFTNDMSFPHVYVAPGGDRVLAMAGLGLYSVAVEGGEPIDMGRLAVTYNNLNSDLVFSPDGNHAGGEHLRVGASFAEREGFEPYCCMRPRTKRA